MFERIKKIFVIDYLTLTQNDKDYIHNKYIAENFRRMLWISITIAIGETVLMLLDLLTGFFLKNPWNYLNLVAELIIIISSAFVRYFGCKLYASAPKDYKKQLKYTITYKALIAVAVTLFIFTDIYVRHKVLGAYIVFLFLFQIMPFFKAKNNAFLYGGFAVTTSLFSLIFTDLIRANSLFGVLMIFLAFFLCAECIRSIILKKLVNNSMNYTMTKRFQSLAYQTTVSLSNAVEAKDRYTKGHSQRVANYSREIAKRLGYDIEQQNEVYYIGLLHDIGKIGVPIEVINKEGKLTDEEYAKIKTHPYKGYEILKNITEIPDISLGARWHHERYDGTGYPDGLKGEEIPVIAQIIAVADAYDAMTSNRSYRSLLAQDIVRGEISRNRGKQFSPRIANIMLKMIDEDKEYIMHE